MSFDDGLEHKIKSLEALEAFKELNLQELSKQNLNEKIFCF